LIEDEADLQRYTSKKVTKKAPKKSTVQETYELWVEKNSIADIIRVLTKQTIFTAFCPTDTNQSVLLLRFYLRINTDLSASFQGYKEESLNALMRKNSDKFTGTKPECTKQPKLVLVLVVGRKIKF
jgi:hypothetical protein